MQNNTGVAMKELKRGFLLGSVLNNLSNSKAQTFIFILAGVGNGRNPSWCHFL